MVSLWQIFWVFAKIGAFTIGGGIPMIAAIKSELVERKWLNDEDFIDIITLAQTAPGLFAVNISILTGHRLRGTKGSVVATIASCLPPDGGDVFHSFQGQRVCTEGIQGHKARGGGAYWSAADRHDQGDKDEVVVVGCHAFLIGPGVHSECFTYIYIDMCHCGGDVYKLAQQSETDYRTERKQP